jgi:hypothetical protein
MTDAAAALGDPHPNALAIESRVLALTCAEAER